MHPGAKDGWCVGLKNLPPSCADYFENWETQPPGNLRACPGIALYIIIIIIYIMYNYIIKPLTIFKPKYTFQFT